MMAAAGTGRRGRRSCLSITGARLASAHSRVGGRRCNFTNRHAAAEHYLSQNPGFCRSALARYPSEPLHRSCRAPWRALSRGTARATVLRPVFTRHSRAAATGVRHSRRTARTPVRRPIGSHRPRPRATSTPSSHRRALRRGHRPGHLRFASVVIATGGLAVPLLGARRSAMRWPGSSASPSWRPAGPGAARARPGGDGRAGAPGRRRLRVGRSVAGRAAAAPRFAERALVTSPGVVRPGHPPESQAIGSFSPTPRLARAG